MSEKLIAFHGQQEIKDKYLARVRWHREQDNLIQGTGWENGKGCAVGCTLESYSHARYPIEMGIPEWLARVEDTIFEGLPKEKAMLWPERFLSAIKPGADLEKVKGPFLIFVLQSTLATFDHEKFPDVKAAIDSVISLWGLPEEQRTSAAADAADAAADAADAAAYAADAAADAADAADAAAYAAARAAAYEKFADKLIELLEAAA